MLALWLNWALGIPGSFLNGRSQPQRQEGRGLLSSPRNCQAPQVVVEIWPTSGDPGLARKKKDFWGPASGLKYPLSSGLWIP